MENLETGTVYVDKINGSTDLNITLMVSGCKLSRVFNGAVEYLVSQSLRCTI